MYFCKMLRICVDNGLEFNKNALKRSWKVFEFGGWDLLLALYCNLKKTVKVELLL